MRSKSSELQTGCLTRRCFLRWLLGLPFLFWSPFRVREILADPFVPLKIRGKGSVAEFFKGEELVYEIGFWLFRKAALGKFEL